MNPLDPLLKFHLGQHVYFWFMLPLHGLVVVLQTISKYNHVKVDNLKPYYFPHFHSGSN